MALAESGKWSEGLQKKVVDPNAKNTGSSASGAYQFLDGTFKHFCVDEYRLGTMKQKNDPDIQIECAVRMIAAGLVGHWDESKPVWSKTF